MSRPGTHNPWAGRVLTQAGMAGIGRRGGLKIPWLLKGVVRVRVPVPALQPAFPLIAQGLRVEIFEGLNKELIGQIGFVVLSAVHVHPSWGNVGGFEGLAV